MSVPAPRLSVAIRAYNQEKEVIRALTSVIEQSFFDPVELVIGVDVSSDNTLSVVREFCNNLSDRFQCKLLAHSERKGGTRNLISVLSACSGDYIAILDADDYWIDKDKTIEQIAVMDAHPEIGLVYGDFIIESPNIEGGSYRVQRPEPEENVFTQLLYGNFLGTNVSMFRRSLLAYVDFPYLGEKGWSQDDYFLWLGLANHTQFYHLKKDLAVYTITRNNDSASLPYEACAYDVTTTEVKDYYIKKYPDNTSLTSADVWDMHYRLQFRAARIVKDYQYAQDAIRSLSPKERKTVLYKLCRFRPFWDLYLIYFHKRHKTDNLNRYFI